MFKKHFAKVAALAPIVLAAAAAHAEGETGGTDMSAAFGEITTKLTTAGGLAFTLALVGAGVWSGIKIFRKGVRAGGGAS